MFSFTLCKAIANDMFDAFVAGGETAAAQVFDAAMDYWDTYGDQRDTFTHHVMDKYRGLQHALAPIGLMAHYDYA